MMEVLVTNFDFDVAVSLLTTLLMFLIVLNVLRLAHIQGNKHKRKLTSLRKQARHLAAAEAEPYVWTVSRQTDAVTDSCVADKEMSD